MSLELEKDLPLDRTELGLADKKPLYSAAEARAEAERCLYCADAPCIKACPTEIDIPTFIKKIASGNVVGSASTIFEQNILGISCSRVCPVEVLCVGDCVYNGWHKEPIQIGKLQRFATETAVKTAQNKLFPPPDANAAKNVAVRKIALIGAGPASLACAAALAMAGHTCTIFEKRSLPGGLNTTGIAPYKLHVEDALYEVALVQSLGVEIKTGVEIGKGVTGQALLTDFDVVYIGVGLGADSKLKIPGEDGKGVALATVWIEEMKLAASNNAKLAEGFGKVLVIGGGNTALDVARECALLGAEDVAMVYRRGRREMSGYTHELDGALKEGVRLVENRQPVSFVHDSHGNLLGLRVARTADGRVIPGSEEEIPCDLAVLTIRQSKLSAIAAEFPGVQLDSRGCVVADSKTGATGNPKVFAGGDCINGGKEVVNAVANGRDTARHLISSWGK
ncbi:MAG: FAD-dependent oxidoreductase [Polyangiaceae bacterium]